MMVPSRFVICSLFVFLASTVTSRGASTSVIYSYGNAPSPVRHAVLRLSDYTKIEVGRAMGDGRSIRIELNTTQNPRISTQGYTIRSSSRGEIAIHANTDEGAANGICTFLRTLMIEHLKDPFSRNWDVEEKPVFSVRSQRVAP